MFVENGHCLKTMGNRAMELAPNSGLFLPPQWIQKDLFTPATTFLSAEFSNNFLGELRESAPVANDAMEISASEVRFLQSRLLQELMDPDPFSALVIEGFLMGAVALAHQRSLPRGSVPPAWLRRASELLREDMKEPKSLTEIAALVGVHPAHLSKEFRRWFHCTPGEYLRELRIESAKEKLQCSEFTLADISLETGFSDQAHFSNVFRKQTGFTPSSFRRNFRKTSSSSEP
jgi:AraC family transcriptional regulator